jgi:hypothetical protein
MCFWSHYFWADCGHPAPDAMYDPCSYYPTCSSRNFRRGTFPRDGDCGCLTYDSHRHKDPRHHYGASYKSSGSKPKPRR